MTPWTVVAQAPLWDFPGKDTGVGCHYLLQGTFPTQVLNPPSLAVSCIGKQVLYHWATTEALLALWKCAIVLPLVKLSFPFLYNGIVINSRASKRFYKILFVKYSATYICMKCIQNWMTTLLTYESHRFTLIPKPGQIITCVSDRFVLLQLKIDIDLHRSQHTWQNVATSSETDSVLFAGPQTCSSGHGCG